MFVSLWRPVASCGTGVVSPKERLLQSQTAVSEAWRPVGCRLGCWDWFDGLQAGAGGIPCLEGCSVTLDAQGDRRIYIYIYIYSAILVAIISRYRMNGLCRIQVLLLTHNLRRCVHTLANNTRICMNMYCQFVSYFVMLVVFCSFSIIIIVTFVWFLRFCKNLTNFAWFALYFFRSTTVLAGDR